MRRVEMMKLKEFFLAHETDIALGKDDFALLRTPFEKTMGRKAYDRTKR